MDISDSAARDGTVAAGACTLRVEAVFRELGEHQLEAVAAAMIDRAHELANRPECECDVDVSIQHGGSPASVANREGGARADAPGSPSES
jgi:hypothetical protein